MELNRRDFIKFLGLTTVACAVPLPISSERELKPDDVTRQTIQKLVSEHLQKQAANTIYDFTVICDERNNPPTADYLQIDYYVKTTKSVSIVHTFIRIDYGFKIDEKYLNRGRYELLDLVGIEALSILETLSS